MSQFPNSKVTSNKFFFFYLLNFQEIQGIFGGSEWCYKREKENTGGKSSQASLTQLGFLFCIKAQFLRFWVPETTLPPDTLSLSQQLSSPKCINGYPANLMLGVTLAWNRITSRGGGREGVQILLIASCYRKWDKHRPDGPLGLYAT